jgi:DNA-3-methyladenine glycosylase
LWIEEGEVLPERAVRRTPRIGVDYAGSWARRPYRFVVSGHHAASGPARLR